MFLSGARQGLNRELEVLEVLKYDLSPRVLAEDGSSAALLLSVMSRLD